MNVEYGEDELSLLARQAEMARPVKARYSLRCLKAVTIGPGEVHYPFRGLKIDMSEEKDTIMIVESSSSMSLKVVATNHCFLTEGGKPGIAVWNTSGRPVELMFGDPIATVVEYRCRRSKCDGD